jgi:hypothetical protein
MIFQEELYLTLFQQSSQNARERGRCPKEKYSQFNSEIGGLIFFPQKQTNKQKKTKLEAVYVAKIMKSLQPR